MKKSKSIKKLEGQEKKLQSEIRSLRLKAGMMGGTTAQKTRLSALVRKVSPVSAKLNNLYYKLSK